MASSLHPGDAHAMVLPALKGLAVFTPLFVAGGMASTTLQFIPSLILSTNQPSDSTRSKPENSGRLTPQQTPATETQGFNLTVPVPGQTPAATPSSAGYKLAAQQFVYMSRTAFTTQVPAEILAILSSTYLAYHHRQHILLTRSAHTWQKWAAVAALLTAVFPLTGALMAPIDHKIARVAGVEEKLEPYEDAPPDREMERGNTEEFLRSWNALNAVRTGMVVVGGGVGLWNLLD